MIMGKITLEKDSKKLAEDAKAAINDATQQNKNNAKTAVDPKITITVEELPPKKAERNEKGHVFRVFICTILILTLIGGGLLIYIHINFFCPALMDMEGLQQYEELQKSYKDLQAQHAELNSQHDLLMRRSAVCMTKFISSVPSLKRAYGEDRVLSMMNQFGEAIRDAIEPTD